MCHARSPVPASAWTRIAYPLRVVGRPLVKRSMEWLFRVYYGYYAGGVRESRERKSPPVCCPGGLEMVIMQYGVVVRAYR